MVSEEMLEFVFFFWQITPFKAVRSLKDKIDAFQASFESLQEAEGEPSKERDSCKLIQYPALPQIL